jgi:ribosomal-protein-alanine N-acetyltransferase
MSCKELETERLLLRTPKMDDVSSIASLIGEWEVAKNLGRVPHPYSEADAQAYVVKTEEARAKGEAFNFVITRKSDSALMGACGVQLRESGNFEFGYWLGKPFWKNGYATESTLRLVSFGFRELNIDRLVAGWFHDNPASGRVLAKLGCEPSGAEQRNCLARGHTVYCHIVTLTRESFAQRKAA